MRTPSPTGSVTLISSNNQSIPWKKSSNFFKNLSTVSNNYSIFQKMIIQSPLKIIQFLSKNHPILPKNRPILLKKSFNPIKKSSNSIKKSIQVGQRLDKSSPNLYQLTIQLLSNHSRKKTMRGRMKKKSNGEIKLCIDGHILCKCSIDRQTDTHTSCFIF